MSRLKLAHNALLRLLRWYENLSFPCTGSSSSTTFEIFLSRINKVSLFRVTSQVYVNNMHKINSLYTILLLFFFNFFVWQVNHFGYLSVSKFLPCTHHSSTNDFSQSFLLVKIIVLYYVFHQNCSR